MKISSTSQSSFVSSEFNKLPKYKIPMSKSIYLKIRSLGVFFKGMRLINLDYDYCLKQLKNGILVPKKKGTACMSIVFLGSTLNGPYLATGSSLYDSTSSHLRICSVTETFTAEIEPSGGSKFSARTAYSANALSVQY